MMKEAPPPTQEQRESRLAEFVTTTGAIKSARRIGGTDKHPLIEVTFNDPTSIPKEKPS